MHLMNAALQSQGIRKIGTRCEEPQGDESPHAHEGLFYEDDKAFKIYLIEYMRQFTGTLKVLERVSKYRERVYIYKTIEDAISNKPKIYEGKKGIGKKHAARVTLTIGAQKAEDGSNSGTASFASYVSKYISKSAGLAVDDDPKHATAEATRAHRAASGIRGFAFYGLPEGTLSGWDELRRINCVFWLS